MQDLTVVRAIDPIDIAAQLLSAPSSGNRAALLASAIADRIPDAACVVYRYNAAASGVTWRAAGFAGDISVVQDVLTAESRLLAPLIAEPLEPIIYSAAGLQREDYPHLQLSRSFASICYLPLLTVEELAGAIEIISFSDVLTSIDFEAIEPLRTLAVPALLSAEDFEHQREDFLDSVHRLTQLYDLEKSLNATLDLDRLTPLVPRKVLPMLQCQAVHLWLFDGDILTVMASAGQDPTVRIGQTQQPGEGYVADMAEEGEPLTLSDPQDERLQRRSGEGAPPVWTAMLVPLMEDEAEIGVLEAVNKSSGEPFDEDDEFFFNSVAETVSSALKNASLMFAERKLAILEALVHVSSEITSTLRLDRLLQIIVNSPQGVLPFERCSIALDNRGKLQLKAISGMSTIPLGDAQVEHLLQLVRWLSTQDEALHLRQQGGSVAPELPEAVANHFAETGQRALFALPLRDDQGRVGMLVYESSDPDFLEISHTEMIKILAGQATVAIRNALLYREVPLISLIEPLMQRKQALLRTTRGRRIGFALAATVATLFLVFCPLPMRLTGEATIAPQHLVTIAAPVDGNVTSVSTREGERIQAGQVLASMNDYQWRMDLASAETRYRSAMLTMQGDLAHGAPEAGTDRAQAEYLRAEADRARNKVENAQLRSPIAGIVVTPSLQDAAGEHLDAGATFAQVLDLSSAVVEIAISQGDASLLAPGQTAAIKLDSYPQRSWHGSVDIVSPQAKPGNGERTFTARVPLTNEEALLRSGMTGHAKISVGYRPAGYVLLRKPALWVWQTLWNWFGW